MKVEVFGECSEEKTLRLSLVKDSGKVSLCHKHKDGTIAFRIAHVDPDDGTLHLWSGIPASAGLSTDTLGRVRTAKY